MIKYTTSAPLPFAGQKRRWIKPLADLLQTTTPPNVIIDLFGGSGLLSRLAKDIFQNTRVIYNDYDNFSERLKHIDETELLRQEIATILSPLDRDKRLPDEYKARVLQSVYRHQERYLYVDWVSLSGWLLFTNNFAYDFDDFASRGFYNHPSRTALSDANASERYLDGLEIVSLDYKELLSKYREHPNVLFIIDPPYFATECGGYKGRTWSNDDYLDLLVSIPTSNYLYFSSTKFDLVPFLRRTSASWGYRHPFVDAEVLTRSNPFGSGGNNTEILYYKL